MVRAGLPEGVTCEHVYLSDGRASIQRPGEGALARGKSLSKGLVWNEVGIFKVLRKGQFLWNRNSERKSDRR